MKNSEDIIRDHESIQPLFTEIGFKFERYGKYGKLNKINKTCDRDRIKRKQYEGKAIFFKFKPMLPSFILDDAWNIFNKINNLKLRGRYSALEHQVLISIKISLDNSAINSDEIIHAIEGITEYSINDAVYNKITIILKKETTDLAKNRHIPLQIKC